MSATTTTCNQRTREDPSSSSRRFIVKVAKCCSRTDGDGDRQTDIECGVRGRRSKCRESVPIALARRDSALLGGRLIHSFIARRQNGGRKEGRALRPL